MSAGPTETLVGMQEDDRTEFKSAEALKKPVTIAREVVAFLNAGGGEIWIGVDEHQNVAISMTGVPNAQTARDALWNHIVDTIEPSPTGDEIRVEVVQRDGKDLLRVGVGQADRGPYALGNSGGQFPIRVGHRVRSMAREEIGRAFRAAPTEQDLISSALARTSKAAEDRIGKPGFWWQLSPSESLHIDFEHGDAEMRRFFEGVLMDPKESKNRSSGWTMVMDETKPQFQSGAVIHSLGSLDRMHEVKILTNGTMTFLAPRTRLSRNWDGQDAEIFPFALIELPASGFRIAARILERYATSRPDLRIVVAAHLGGMAETKLAGGSPQDPLFDTARGRWSEKIFEGADLVTSPFDMGAQDVIKNPDEGAYRLVRRIYEQFGFEDALAAIPPEFDRTSHILRFR